MSKAEPDARKSREEDALMPRDMRQSLPIALLRAREAVMGRFRPVLSSFDVTEQQWRVIRVLDEESPLDASDVAERACILAPSVTRIIKALEDRSLIERRRDASDGRRVLLSITPAGTALIRDVAPRSRAIYLDLEARYGSERMDVLLQMLDELADLKA